MSLDCFASKMTQASTGHILLTRRRDHLQGFARRSGRLQSLLLYIRRKPDANRTKQSHATGSFVSMPGWWFSYIKQASLLYRSNVQVAVKMYPRRLIVTLFWPNRHFISPYFSLGDLGLHGGAGESHREEPQGSERSCGEAREEVVYGGGGGGGSLVSPRE